MPDVRADFHKPAWLAPEDFQWVSSPQAGVERVMLDRVGDEVAVATSLVRYAAGSRFPAHEHGLGEEYLVLEGEFGDEHGRYGPGTYVRNPPGSRHTPFSDPGCVIWVKLRQFHPDDQCQLVTEVDLPMPPDGCGLRKVHEFHGEVVTTVAAQGRAVVRFPGQDAVQEVLVVDGSVRWREETLNAWGWLRIPAGEPMEFEALEPSRLLHKSRPAFALPHATGARSAASAGR